MKTFISIFVLLLASFTAQAVDSLENVKIGKKGYNRFTFGEPFVNVVMPPDAPVMGAPIKLADEATIMFEIYPEAVQPFQMIAHLVNGDIVTLNLVPVDGHPAAIWSNRNRMSVPEEARMPIQRPEDNWLQVVFKDVVQGKVPDGFVRVKPPVVGSIGGLSANYLAAFKNDSYVMLVARLTANHRAFIQPQDLYVPGIKAIILDGDRVGGMDAPIAYVLMSGMH